MDENSGPSRRTDNQYEHLKLVLGFFPRADAKTQFLTGLSVGMLGFLATVIDVTRHWSLIVIGLTLIAVALLLHALVQLYMASYPNTQGGEESLIYFHEIAKLRESSFIDRVLEISETDLANDLAAQTWRNAAILDSKFASLKKAQASIMLAVVPWLLASGISMAIKQNPTLRIP